MVRENQGIQAMDQRTAVEIATKYISFIIKNNYKIVKAILFGSFAKGNFNDDSDIDLAIIIQNLENEFNTQVQLLILTKQIDTRIEPHPFDEKDFNNSNPLAVEIMEHGINIL
jgi:uncharacterized protein